MTNSKVKIGIVGLGHMGQAAHLINYFNLQECEVVAISDKNVEILSAVQKRFSISNAYPDHLALLKECEVDGVVAVTDRESTLEVARDVLNSGVHLFTEKPIGLSLDLCKPVVEIAQKKKLVYKIGYMRKFDLAVKAFKKELEDLHNSGKFGNLVYIRVHCLDSVASYAGGFDTLKTERASKKENGSKQVPSWLPNDRLNDYLYFLNAFCHHFNLLNWIFDRHVEIDDVKIMHTDFDDLKLRTAKLCYGSVKVMLELGRGNSLNQDEYMEAFYDYGVLRLELPPNMLRDKPGRLVRKNFLDSKYSEEIIDFGYDWAFRNQAKDFLQNIIERNTDCINSGLSALADLQIIEELWRRELKRVESRGDNND